MDEVENKGYSKLLIYLADSDKNCSMTYNVSGVLLLIFVETQRRVSDVEAAD
jgi:hypothetical protein